MADKYRIRIGEVAAGTLQVLAHIQGKTLERAAADAIAEELRRENTRRERRKA